MKLSQTAEYALRAMVFLASEPGRPMTTRLIAEGTQTPPNYLSKVILALVREGLVQSQRGLHGGSTLTRRPQDITLLEVINAVEPVQHIERCPLNLDHHQTRLCPLHRRLEEVVCAIEQVFGSTTLADLLEDPASRPPLCQVKENDAA